MSHYKLSLFLFWAIFILALLTGNILFISSVVAIFLIAIGVGSYKIQSNFYLTSVCKAPTDKKNVILSFDDGPSPVVTPLILDILKEFNCKAVFFCIGKNISGNELILKRIVEEGHLIGNHSYSHSYWFDFYSSKRVQDEIVKTNEEIFKVTGLKCKLFRPPYGVTNPMIAKALKRLGILSIGWNKRSLDTVIKDAKKIFQRISENTRPGDIILLHDSVSRGPEILKEYLYTLYNKTDYTVERLDKVIEIECYES